MVHERETQKGHDNGHSGGRLLLRVLVDYDRCLLRRLHDTARVLVERLLRLQPVVLILANISLMTHSKFRRLIGYYGLVVAMINLLFVVFSNTPLLEWFTVFTALFYVALLSYNTLNPPS